MTYINKKVENLQVSPKLLLYSKTVLSQKLLQDADLLAVDIIGKYTKPRAIYTLRKIIGAKPKRPIYYVYHELDYLPTWTRNIIRYLGDYIDQLVKFLTAEKLQRSVYLNRSLGSNLKNIDKKDILPSHLLTQLTKYNELLYVPAKHDFDIGNRNHRFTSKEVVYACFITMQLAEELKKLSERAREYSEERTYEYYVYDILSESSEEELTLFIRLRYYWEIVIYKLTKGV